MGGDGALRAHRVGGVTALLHCGVAGDVARHLSLGVLRDVDVLVGACCLLYGDVDQLDSRLGGLGPPGVGLGGTLLSVSLANLVLSKHLADVPRGGGRGPAGHGPGAGLLLAECLDGLVDLVGLELLALEELLLHLLVILLLGPAVGDEVPLPGSAPVSGQEI